jgi:glyoxylase-like metal-dependent hydrolase (beta-lactamase superfamily II)
MSTHLKLAAAGVLLSALIAAAGCSAPAGTTEPAAAATPAADPDVTRFRIGSLEAIAFKDGGLTAPNDNRILGVGRTPEDVAAVLTANGLPGDSISLSIQPLFVRDGQRLVLIDAGAGTAFGENGGKLAAGLVSAGIDPAGITDVLISHSHSDHVVGLINAEGGLAFPNATVRMAEAEWNWMKENPELANVVAAITPRVETFAPGAQLTPSIRAVAIEGHTPGHSGYEVASGSERLLYIGDAMHHSVVSVQRPEWQIAFDDRAPVATASRVALTERAAQENLRIYAVHFPYPGLGRIQKTGETFAWVPETVAP